MPFRFWEDALVRINPSDIKKKESSKNGSVFYHFPNLYERGFDKLTHRSIDKLTHRWRRQKIDFPEITDTELAEVDAYGYMYILQCADGSFYTGSTKDLALRIEQHKMVKEQTLLQVICQLN